MIGARHSAGSTISNGGDSSPLIWVIFGRRPGIIRRSESFVPEKRSSYEDIFSVITTILPSEKTLNGSGTYLKYRKRLPSLLWDAFRSRNSATSGATRALPLHPKFTVCRA